MNKLIFRQNGKLSRRNCTSQDCPLVERRFEHFVGFRGDTKAKVLCLGEAPGEKEVRKRVPFIGRSGKRLSKLMSRAGFSLDSYYVTNPVKCRPIGNVTPGIDAITECAHIFLKELDMVKPTSIICWGRIAVKALCYYSTIGESDDSFHFMEESFLGRGIIKSTGNCHKVIIGETKYLSMVLPHPSYLIRKNNLLLEKKIVDRLAKLEELESTFGIVPF